jgi:hypothetical protein
MYYAKKQVIIIIKSMIQQYIKNKISKKYSNNKYYKLIH